MNIYKLLSITYYLGMVALLLGILSELNNLSYSFILLLAGVIPFFGVRLFNYLKGKPENRRKHGILVVSALFMTMAVAAVYFNRSYWILGVLIAATLDLYISFRKFI
jgi:predicted MFS family arabinose efflux permease